MGRSVTSQQRRLPSCHGIKDRPSGLLPSDLDRPLDSLVTGMPADTRVVVVVVVTIIIISSSSSDK